MESIFSIVTSFLMAVTGAAGIGTDAVAVAPSSSEIGIAELSPAGEAGGYAMPASGCSDNQWHGNGLHDCGRQPIITIDDPIVRTGEETTLRWDNNGIDGCVLVGNVAEQGPVTGPGFTTISPVADTTYIIICDNEQTYTQTAFVRVLPRIQET